MTQAHAQVSLGNVTGGPLNVAPAYSYDPPACSYGYYGYAAYACAPYGDHGLEGVQQWHLYRK
jgi:hypothetical protein